MDFETWLSSASEYLKETWGIDDYFSRKAATLWAYLWSYGLNPQITSGLRTKEKQKELMRRYKQGDSSVVYPPSPTSKHLHGLAIDISTNDPELAHRIASALGVKTVPGDSVHFEEP